MNARSKFAGFLLSSILLFSLAWTASPPPLVAQDVVVSAAIPDNAPQGMVNLNVQVKGNGFKKGAIAKWLVTGSETDTGGVTVNSTKFINSKELLANITVAADAQTQKKLDIKVTLTSGRTGKGIELFAVTAPSDNVCTSAEPASGDLDAGFFGWNEPNPSNRLGTVMTNTDGNIPSSADMEHANNVAIQADGKIVVAGATGEYDATDFALVRYNGDGSLDTTFGPAQAGIVITDFSGVGNDASTVAIQSDGKLVVAGWAKNSSGGQDLAVARYDTYGNLDPAFGSGGKTTVSGACIGQGLAIDTNSNIVVMGGGGAGLCAARLTATGSLDTSFGTGGVASVSPSARGGGGYTGTLQPDGKIVVVGNANSKFTGSDFAVARFTSSGALDTTFGAGGVAIADFFKYSDNPRGVAIDANNNIVVAGSIRTSNEYWSSADFGLARFTPTGQLDTAFGTSGKVHADFYGSWDEGYAVGVQADGKIVAAGFAENGPVMSSTAPMYFAMVRYNTDGTLDTSFGCAGTGKVTTNAGGHDNYAYGVALDGVDYKIILAGTSYPDDMNLGYYFTLARYWQ